MKREEDSSLSGSPATPAAPANARAKVSIQAIYAEAMREVMADPRKAVAEHDPWLAKILPPLRSSAGDNA